MIGASKILTVSYGTFSCTLEGFDDPFNTMKAIAEYFRDLAAEDRYFGAEPPQPDAAMLHRIAEREIQRRVEARVQDNGVILRADSEAAPVARLAEPEPAMAASPAPAVIPAQQAAAVTESVAAKLSKLRAAKAGSVAAPLDFPAAAEADEPEALLPDPGLAEFLSPAVVSGPATHPAADLAAELSVEPGAAAVPEVVFEEEIVEPVVTVSPDAVAEVETVAEPVPDADVILADVIRTEVGAAAIAPVEAEPVEATPVATPEPDSTGLALPEGLADELDDAAARALSDALSGFMSEPAALHPEQSAEHSVEELFPEGDALPDDVEDILPESALISAAEAPEDVDLAALIAGYQPEGDARPESAEAVAATVVESAEVEVESIEVVEIEAVEIVETAPQDLDLETLIGSLAEETRIAEAPAAPLATTEPVAETLEDVAEVAAEPVIDDLAMAEDGDEPLAAASPAADEQADAEEPAVARPDATEKLQRARARVVRIRRSDAEAASVVTTEPTTVATDVPAVEASPEPAEPRRKLEVEADDAALNRLIAQTNTEMEGPEAKRRLSAIAHLKAAVAATVAERLTRGKTAPTEAARAEPYRDDLARAVRPQRPEAPGVRGERPAPLVLVSEQRIDRPAPAAPAQAPAHVSPAHVSPVRPRRVTSAALAVQADDEDDEDEDGANIFADTRGFVEFAEKLGVRSLPDLMEAAAAYTASVEGRPHFSRPHLIRHLSAARGQEIPREDSLRTFGRLLREGRIEKVKRGQFAVNEGSRFLGEAKKING